MFIKTSFLYNKERDAMKNKGIIIGTLVAATLSIVGAFSIATVRNTKQSIIAANAGTTTREITITNISSFFSNKYVTTKLKNRINFAMSKCSGSTVSLGGYFYNTTKFNKVKSITVNFNTIDHLICYYGSSSNPTSNNYALESGCAQTINSSYFKIANPDGFNSSNISISSIKITYEC